MKKFIKNSHKNAKFDEEFEKKSEIQFFNREKMLTIFGWNFEIEERCKGVHCVDLDDPFLNLLFEKIAYSNGYLVAKIGVDTAENEPLEVWGKIIQYYSFVSSVSRPLRWAGLLGGRALPQSHEPAACHAKLLILLSAHISGHLTAASALRLTAQKAVQTSARGPRQLNVSLEFYPA